MWEKTLKIRLQSASSEMLVFASSDKRVLCTHVEAGQSPDCQIMNAVLIVLTYVKFHSPISQSCEIACF